MDSQIVMAENDRGSFVERISGRTLALLLVGAGLMLAQPCRGASIGFERTGSLANARYGHTATLLPNGKVLVVGGYTVEHGNVASAELYDPASGTWTATGSLTTPRGGHTATLLPNGKVLVVGGWRSQFFVGSMPTELYDPVSGTWATIAIWDPGSSHTATLLPNGKVLVAAGFAPVDGYGAGGSHSAARLYDPASESWTATASLTSTRSSHTPPRCCPMARCSSQEVATTTHTTAMAHVQPPNSTIRPPVPGLQPGASRALARPTRRYYSPTARCLSQEVFGPAPVFPAPNSTTRPARPGQRPAASPPRGIITR